MVTAEFGAMVFTLVTGTAMFLLSFFGYRWKKKKEEEKTFKDNVSNH